MAYLVGAGRGSGSSSPAAPIPVTCTREAMTVSSAHLLVLRHLWVLRRNRPWALVVNGIFEPFLYLRLDRRRHRPARRQPRRRRAGRHRVRGVRRPGPAGHVGDEQRGQRDHRQGLVAAEVRAVLRRDPRHADAASPTSRSARWRRPCCAAPSRRPASSASSPRSGWCTRGGRCSSLPAAVLISFAFAGAGLAVTTYPERVPPPPVRAAGHAADVPVRDDLLPAVGLPAAAAVARGRACRSTSAPSCCAGSCSGRSGPG